MGIVAQSPSTPGSSGQRQTGGIIVPKADTFEYRWITLPNDLKVVLVHDPETDKAAASLDVSVALVAPGSA